MEFYPRNYIREYSRNAFIQKKVPTYNLCAYADVFEVTNISRKYGRCIIYAWSLNQTVWKRMWADAADKSSKMTFFNMFSDVNEPEHQNRSTKYKLCTGLPSLAAYITIHVYKKCPFLEERLKCILSRC